MSPLFSPYLLRHLHVPSLLFLLIEAPPCPLSSLPLSPSLSLYLSFPPYLAPFTPSLPSHLFLSHSTLSLHKFILLPSDPLILISLASHHSPTAPGRKSGKGCFNYSGRKGRDKTENKEAQELLQQFSIPLKGRYVQ